MRQPDGSTTWMKTWMTACAVLLAGSAAQAAGHAWQAAAPAESEGRLAACCEPLPPSRAEGWTAEKEGPPHHLLDDGTRRRQKELARWSPTAPRGVDRMTGSREAPGPSSPAPLAPDVATRFDGMNILTETSTGLWIPPDTILAVGPTKVLEGTNPGLRLSARDGSGARVSSLQAFFRQDLDAHVFDPKVYYDRLSGRFFVVAVGKSEAPRTSFVYLAVSRSQSPSAFGDEDWCRYQLNSLRQGAWADYPGLGVNEAWLAITANHFFFDDRGFFAAHVWAVDKLHLVDNAASCPRASFRGFRPEVDADGVTAATIQPAQHYDVSGLPDSPLFLLSTQPRIGSDRYALWRISGSRFEELRITRSNLSGGEPYESPPDAPQLGGDDLDTGSRRVTQAAYRGGRLWAVHATGCQVGEGERESCVRAVEIVPDEHGAEMTFLETFGGPGWYAWWPGVAVNSRGDVVVAFQRSRADRFLDVAFNGRPAGADGFDTVQTFRLGGCTLFNDFRGVGVNRTGDYVGAQTDPVDDLAFWIAGEYTGPLAGRGCDWKTSIGKVGYQLVGGDAPVGPAPLVPPAPAGTGAGDDPPAPSAAEAERRGRPEDPPRRPRIR